MVFGENSGNADSIVDAEADKPAEQEDILHLIHQLPLGSDREQDLYQASPDQPFRRNRGAAEVEIKRLESGIEAGQSIIHYLPDLAQRVIGGIRSSRST